MGEYLQEAKEVHGELGKRDTGPTFLQSKFFDTPVVGGADMKFQANVCFVTLSLY